MNCCKNDLLYIDKTRQIYHIVDTGKYFFLSRPRRFGKSLTVSTIKYLFLGKKEYFEGLWIENKWNWKTTNPVLHFRFNLLDYQDMGLKPVLIEMLKEQAKIYGIRLKKKTVKSLFKELLKKLYQKEGKIVILVDEYDKPILDYLGIDEEQTIKNQRILKNFYSIIKDYDDSLRFFFVTGVSKFSKVGMFSDLNNLTDLTFDPNFIDALGYTQAELEHYFAPYIQKICTSKKLEKTHLLAEIKKWYNGYSWDGEVFVYNPFSVLNFFYKDGKFLNYWVDTGTPSFLINLLENYEYYDFEGKEVGSVAFESYDIQNIELIPLLFQAGYVTIKEIMRNLYILGYPNVEVKESMLQHLMGVFSHGKAADSASIAYRVEQAFLNDDLETVMSFINRMFANIPFHLFQARDESYYHSLIHILFDYIGIYIKSEVITSRGRADAVVETDTHVYIIEFKLDKSAESAIKQIKERGYNEQHSHKNKTIKLIGVSFSSKEKKVDNWLEEIV